MRALWSKDEVILFDGELAGRKKANLDYMMSLSADNLLRNHMFEAGRYQSPAIPAGIHGGWESPTCQVRGHFMGHWLSAAASYYYSTGNREIKARAEAMVAELAECQKNNGGEWVASIPEKYLYWIANRKAAWAPQYTIHKTFMGLLDMAQHAGCAQALEIAESFAKWFLRWTENFTRDEFDDILDVETGGMLEIWAQLLELTGNGIYLKLMDKYYRARLFDALIDGGDPLTNMHANTTIPEIIGCARAYDVTGEKRYRDIAEAYWECAVTFRGSYATGGQTCGEIWTPMQKLDQRLGEKTQEYCTVYNMMRLAEYLFRWTGKAKYADYWEQNLYNGIMAQSYWKGEFTHGAVSDMPHSGLLTYFLPLMPGARKGWASETQDFFCCHGTLVQSNALMNRGIYYQNGDTLYVCQYFDSEARIGQNGQTVSLRQTRDSLAGSSFSHPDCHVARFWISAENEAKLNLRFRVPYWIKGAPCMYINEKKAECATDENGFLDAGRIWKNGDTIKLVFPMGIAMSAIPGNDDLVSFSYGPMALAGLCDDSRSLKLPEKPENLLVHDNEREWGSWKNNFCTVGQQFNTRFVPLKEIGYERYTVYFEANMSI